MVRTRAKKGAAASRQKENVNTDDTTEQSEELWKSWLLDFEQELNGRFYKLNEKLQEETRAIDRNLLVMLAKVPANEANLQVSRLATVLGESTDSIDSFDSTLTSTIKKPGKGFVTSTAFKAMPPPQDPEPKIVRKSRARTKRTRTSSLTDVSSLLPEIGSNRRMTRSSSQPRDNFSKIIPDYQTPMNRPDRTMVAVTPKVDPYSAMPLKRYARQGEMAISLTGSPLMMTTSITEPNISLPLNNGQEVYSILPTNGPCPVIPSIDNSTRQKLHLLRENLNRILGE
ncbi:uncharacterized protein LOC117646317 [Thrips palmi]|uniref:Uncharacterized protein LOC117646317 n=1 Tax=Thrips palmi TaxID=161013 RepID=A0A6P8ZNW8_THRPL|nr:uncharacterized protein LOC117646317 [Thrips palmi]XP_034243080.1 uncharacterized protein LOC117646317 [Thrips palmi]XP_034243081.1 uncharacterized protein LOC117646317 [Thrips palmi]XP_034243082.1 uncharacterized protein LOC117646317 [Thrips palmi]XP_034243083.1 uncharacterized protein LOC117646317 [Thrips palmi]